MGTGQTAHSFIKRNASRELGRFWRAAQDGGLRDVPATFADLADTSHARLGAERGVGGYTLRRFRLVVCQKVFIISTVFVFAGWDINEIDTTSLAAGDTRLHSLPQRRPTPQSNTTALATTINEQTTLDHNKRPRTSSPAP
jgi:hypothetical protein